jgi:hypothetical protein
MWDPKYCRFLWDAAFAETLHIWTYSTWTARCKPGQNILVQKGGAKNLMCWYLEVEMLCRSTVTLAMLIFRAGETIIITTSWAITTPATAAAAPPTAGPVPSSYH